MRKQPNLLRSFLLLLLATITILLVLNWDLLQYGLMQAKGQFHILRNAVTLDEFASSNTTPDSIRRKINFIPEIKRFAESELGLNANGQYTKIYDQNFKEVMWVVTAAEPFALQNYQWSFPILGKLSYKGFFVEEKAEIEADSLLAYGYDVNIRTASAWSTLGFFDDPLLSNVLYQRTEGELAELIIHELTHDFLYIADSVDFNENYASFIGKIGAMQYLKKKYSTNAPQVIEYEQKLGRQQEYYSFMQEEFQNMQLFYSKIASFDLLKRAQLKFNYLDQLKNRIKEKYPSVLKREGTYYQINNAWMMAFDRYSGSLQILESQLKDQYSCNLKAMLSDYKERFNSI